MQSRPPIVLKLLFSALMCLGLLIQPLPAHAKKLRAPDSVIPEAYFGMHIERAGSTTPWPSVPFKTWRLWDAHVTWQNLEPAQGNWHFELLDRLVALAENNGVEVILPLALTPGWASARPWESSSYSPGNAAEPRDIADWRSYVRTVGTRYKGRIHCYEIWNEPNLKMYFSGTVQDMVALTRAAHEILKEIDPSVTVVSSAPTGDGSGLDWFDDFLRNGGGSFADVIGYHFYVSPSPPEAMAPLISRVKSILRRNRVAKPLWNTESGWDHRKTFTSDEEAAAFVARSYIVNWAAGVGRSCWYAWDNKDWVSLRLTQNDDATLTPAGIAYRAVHDWLAGARMGKCSYGSAGTWTCSLSRYGGYLAWIVWNAQSNVSFRVKKGWKIKSIRTLSGGSVEVSDTIAVGMSPLLLENMP